MTLTHDLLADPRIQAALTELRELIRGRYPEASFSTYVGFGDDPNGVYLEAMLDVEDRIEASDVYIDRLVDLRVEEGLPVNVMLRRTPERNAAVIRSLQAEAACALPPTD